MKGNVNYLELANSPLMWVSAAIAVGIVVFQSVLFFRKSLKAAKEIGIEQEKINMAIKSSAISSIGPSIVILVTMISLIVSMGAPVSWMRLSFIGSVNYEAMAAGFGAQAMGATLENLTPVAFACGVWTMISRSFFADSSYMLSFSVLCSCVCSRLISPSVSSWHKQDNTLMHQSPGHIQRRTPYNF